MTTNFTAIDLELANRSLSSICQIGVAEFVGTDLVQEWMTYIDPETTFGAHNIFIHGITKSEVHGWPKLPEVAKRLHELLDGKIVLSHSGTDRVALESAFDRYGLPRLQCTWLDSAKVAQRAWAGFKKGGYGLQNLCRLLEYRYHSHDALGDAKASGVVVLAAIDQTGVGLDEWLRQVEQPIGEGPRVPIRPLSQLSPGTVDNASVELVRPTNRLISPALLSLLEGQNADSDHDRQSSVSS